MFQYFLLTLPERKKKNVKKDKIFPISESNIRINTYVRTYVYTHIYNNPKTVLTRRQIFYVINPFFVEVPSKYTLFKNNSCVFSLC